MVFFIPFLLFPLLWLPWLFIGPVIVFSVLAIFFFLPMVRPEGTSVEPATEFSTAYLDALSGQTPTPVLNSSHRLFRQNTVVWR